MIDYGLIGKRIQRARVAAGLTQEALVERVQISTNYLSKVENGREKPNLEMLAKISSAVGIPLTSLLADAVEGTDTYLQGEMAVLLKSCSAEQNKLIYEIAKCIVKNNGRA
jgi:transcriptional regulator with XRE-family HTH domain